MAPRIPAKQKSAKAVSIKPVPTSATAFIGLAMRGPLNKALHIRSFAGFKRKFGNVRDDLELGHAVAQFFRNGGRDAWVVRISRPITLAKIKNGLAALDRVVDVNLLLLPGVTRRESIEAALAYAVLRRAFVIIDPPNAASVSALLAKLGPRTFRNGSNGAMFFPWLKISTLGKPIRLSAPSGTVAGLFVRNDRDQGIWKAPAGKNAALNGVIGLSCDLTQAEIQQLQARGINSLREIPNNGFVSWGARTLASDDEPQTEWKYIPVRRLALFVEESIARGTRGMASPTNDESLWVVIRSGTSKLLNDLWRKGAFAGRTPKDAYFVKCDRTTMTQDDIDNGRLIVVIGFAPLKPAEFVIIRIGQWIKDCEDC